MLPSRPDIENVHEWFRPYLKALPAGRLMEVLALQRLEMLECLGSLGPQHGEVSYASDKWTVSQLLGHLADTEAVLRNRMLHAARADSHALPGFDENEWARAHAPEMGQAKRTLFSERRLTEERLWELREEDWDRTVVAEGRSLKVRDLAWIIPGHMAHHLKVLRERYQPLLPPLKAPELIVDMGQGLLLRDLRLSDAPELFRQTEANREHLSEWLGWVPSVKKERDTRNFVLASRQGWLGSGRPVLVLEVDGALCGLVDLHLCGRSHAAAIGYWLSPSASGRGLMTRACRWLIDYAFDQLKLDRVEIHCAEKNTRSRAIPERLGLPEEGIQRGAERLHDSVVDLVLYAVTRETWKQMNAESGS